MSIVDAPTEIALEAKTAMTIPAINFPIVKEIIAISFIPQDNVTTSLF
jgi:hypothetical protein